MAKGNPFTLVHYEFMNRLTTSSFSLLTWILFVITNPCWETKNHLPWSALRTIYILPVHHPTKGLPSLSNFAEWIYLRENAYLKKKTPWPHNAWQDDGLRLTLCWMDASRSVRLFHFGAGCNRPDVSIKKGPTRMWMCVRVRLDKSLVAHERSFVGCK